MSADVAALTSGADELYFEGLLEGEVRVQECAGCAKIHWPAVFRCPACGSWEHRWKPVRPEGTVYSWTRTWHDFGGPEAFKPPFVPVVVSLSDCPSVRLLGTLDGANDEVRIGAAVQGRITKIGFLGRDIPSLIWSLAEEA